MKAKEKRQKREDEKFNEYDGSNKIRLAKRSDIHFLPQT
jgi:hypothetical protein